MFLDAETLSDGERMMIIMSKKNKRLRKNDIRDTTQKIDLRP